MYKNVERSIALWKAQHGPIRENIGKHLQGDLKQWVSFDARPEHEAYINHMDKRCD